MLSELVTFSERATLISRSGVQFMDFGLTLDLKKEAPGAFVLQASERSPARLEYQPRTDRFVHPGNPGIGLKPKFEVAVEESFSLLQACWLPLPFLRAGPEQQFARGPTTWARGRIVALAEGEDVLGHTHRLTIAFDTIVLDDADDLAYMAPTVSDVQAGASFRLAHSADKMGWFVEEPWIDEWLSEVFHEHAPARLGLPDEDVAAEVAKPRFSHLAHYLNWLAVIGEKAKLPEVVVRSNDRDDRKGLLTPIPVDMVLDVGNSRTCGILIEDHPQQGHGLKNRYELALRDLSQPHRVYAEPFESRIEFAQVVLGKDKPARKSGRNDAFVWPTIARVGREAARLADLKRGTEGSTGLSSPKRYLWDEDRYQPGWRFNIALSKSETAEHATGAPFSNLVNELGEALYTLNDDDRMPVFMPHYSRSAMMTFMLAEILTHALVQINSPAQRLKQGDPEKPRHLRSIILTVPPSMPKPERDIFSGRMHQAMALVWKALGWQPEDHPIEQLEVVDGKERPTAWPPYPGVHTDWDEATCAQVVWLFSESQEHFGGRPEDLFRAIRRRRDGAVDNRVTVASIDIGGGTTDLVITDYRLDAGAGANVYIIPEQRFRDGFKVAGDDLLLEVVQKLVVPAIEDALKAHGVNDPAPLLSRLIGSEPIAVQDQALRQQLALQILYPLGLRILKAYEQYNPVTRAELHTAPIAALLAGREQPSEGVLRYFANGVRQLRLEREDFDLLTVPVTIDLHRLHTFFVTDQLEICKTVQALCEIVHLYHCDALLLSGRPSRLPGIQALIRALLAMPPDRIQPLHGYRAGTWYPFHKDGRVDDPKTTAAVGAMLCKVGGEGRIPNFYFLAKGLTSYSTVRYIGLMDQNMIIKDQDVYYRDVRLDDAEYELPEQPIEWRGRMVLGFRQLASERWGGSPLYVLDLEDAAKQKLAARSRGAAVLKVPLRRRRSSRHGTALFEVAGNPSSDQGSVLSRNDVSLKLNTLNTVGIGETSYWLDTGSVIR